MSRQPKAIQEEADNNFDKKLLAQDGQAAQDLLEIKAGYSEDRDLANQLLGQAQMADAFEQFSRTVRTSKLAFIREKKLYRSLKGMKTANGSLFSGTWDDYCLLLGTTRDKVELDIANLSSFGEEALEAMSKMGIGYRELRQYRKLPEDQKLALIEVAKVGDKESFVELAEEIIAKHAKEKEATTLEKEATAKAHAAALAEAQAQLAAKQRALDASSATIAGLHDQLGGDYEPSPGSIAKTQQEEKLLEDITAITQECGVMMSRLFLAADTTFEAPVGDGIKAVARQAVVYLCQQLADVATEFGIKVDFEAMVNPPWMSEAMVEALETQEAQAQAKEDAKAATKGSSKTKLSAVKNPAP